MVLPFFMPPVFQVLPWPGRVGACKDSQFYVWCLRTFANDVFELVLNQEIKE